MAFTRYGSGLRGGAVLLCGAALLVLAGCGGGSSSSSSLSPSSHSTPRGSLAESSAPGGSAAPSAPTISGSPVTHAEVGHAYSFTPVVANASGQTISFSVQNKPSWASFSIATGQLTGTPTSSDVGTDANIVISVNNGTSGNALAPFTVTVSQASSGSVTLSWTAPTLNTDGSPLIDLGGYTIDYGTNPDALTQSVTVGTSSATTYTIASLAAGTWYFSVAAYTTDGTAGPPSTVVSTTVD